MKTSLTTLKVLKYHAKIGFRPVGSTFSAEKASADVWIKQRLVRDVSKNSKK